MAMISGFSSRVPTLCWKSAVGAEKDPVKLVDLLSSRLLIRWLAWVPEEAVDCFRQQLQLYVSRSESMQ